jgi:TetR/AcrR family tetracycline transcriptional repressor
MSRHGTDTAVERRGEIVAAALELLDRDGFERLSLRRLATHLGMHAPGLYWYIESKQELIDLMAKAILDTGLSPVPPIADGQTWDEWLVELACTMHRTLLAHRDGARVVASAFIVRTGSITAVAERALEILEGEGFDPLVALGGAMTVLRFAMGLALAAQASPLYVPKTATINQQLAKLQLREIDAAKWPRVAAAIGAAFRRRLSGNDPADTEQVVRFGAQMIVRGLAEKALTTAR